MPRTVRVESAGGGYDVLIGCSLLSEIGRLCRAEFPDAAAAALVADRNVLEPHAAVAAAALSAAGFALVRSTVPPGEENKSLERYSLLLDDLVRGRLERSSPVVAVGGGVVGDLAGFAAATYLRGVPLVMAPTTLLAMVDSSVGGKTGVDHPLGKNLIGAFHAPSLVVADLATLATLPRAESVAGAAEIVKYGVIGDAALFESLERDGMPDGDAALEALVARCVEIKAGVVGRDERESGRRRILNFGHTIGHAVEAATGYSRFRHGEAVAIGMAAAARLAERAGVASAGERIPSRLDALLGRIGLPSRIPADVGDEPLLEAIGRDKKARAGRVHFVLPVRIGEVVVTPDVPLEAVRATLAICREKGA